MLPDCQEKALEGEKLVHVVDASQRKTKNLYNKMEWAGAFGDIGTLIPFVVAYITIVKVEPLGLLFMFGICLAGFTDFYYRTPLPVQPMKAIGGGSHRRGHQPGGAFRIGNHNRYFLVFRWCDGGHQAHSKTCDQAGCKGHHAGSGSFFHG